MPKHNEPVDLVGIQEMFAKIVTGFGDSKNFSKLSIIPAGELTNEAALSVYSRAYVARLTETLGETFEAVWRVLGDECFFQTTQSFIKLEASVSYNLSDFGLGFPAFLEGLYVAEFPFLHHLARFEWVFKTVFHAPQHEALPLSKIINLTLNDDVRMYFGPSVALFNAPFSVYELWKSRKEKILTLDLTDLNLSEDLLFYKNDSKVFTHSLSHTEFSILKSLLQGDPLSKALAQTNLSTTPAEITSLFQLIFTTGIISDLKKG